MLEINNKLKELHEKKTPIKVSLVGAGLMGKGLVSQMMLVKGMMPSLVVSHKIEDAIKAYTLAGVSRDDIKIAANLEDINVAMENNKFVVTDVTDLASKPNLIDVVVDATGVPNTGAKLAFDSILNRKHIVITRNTNYLIPDNRVTIVHNIRDILKYENYPEEVFIIGGEKVYSQMLPYCSRLYLTEIMSFEDGDAHFPEFNRKGYKVIEYEKHCDKNIKYTFLTFEKKFQQK